MRYEKIGSAISYQMSEEFISLSKSRLLPPVCGEVIVLMERKKQMRFSVQHP